MMKNILLLGASGSIGTQSIEIIREHKDKLCLKGVSVGKNIEYLRTLLEEFDLKFVYSIDKQKELMEKYPNVHFYYGNNGLERIVREEDYNWLENALVGFTGFKPTLNAIRCGKNITLANKETLVAGGDIINAAVKQYGVTLLPIDSEHSAILQCLQGHNKEDVKKLIVTASGGAFRDKDRSELKNVTLQDALKHPTWSMGNKITIDSATMMNKGLEVIEAKWLFDIEPDKIDVHVHPESIVHSMVEFDDTSIIAQLGLPDMRIPISLALGYPSRLHYSGKSLNMFTEGSTLHFEKPDTNVFECLSMAYEAIEKGGSYPILLNGANEELVAMILDGKIDFLDIQRSLRRLMDEHKSVKPQTIEDILEIDKEARARAKELFK